MKYIKVMFLGTGNGLQNDRGIYHSNLIVSYNNDRLFIDCGSTFPDALRDAKLCYGDVKNLYISHIHADHAGGLEWLGFANYFDSGIKKKIELFAATEVRRDLATMLRPSMAPSIQGMAEQFGLQSCFSMREPNGGFSIGEMKCNTIKTLHVNAYGELYSYGLFIEVGKYSVLFTSDTQFNPDVFMEYYKKATLILHDCSTSPEPYPAHAHITQLATLPPEIKSKMILYHYGPGEKPDVRLMGFRGYAKQREPLTVR